MKRKSGGFIKDYGAVKIWLEDLFEIESILRKLCRTTNIQTKKYEFDSVQELLDQSHDKVIYEIEIEGNEPRITLDFRRHNISLYGSSDDHALLGAVHQIEEILKRSGRKPALLYKFWMFPIAGLLPGILVSLKTTPIIPILFLMVILGWFGWAAFIGLNRASVIVLQRRSESKSFFARNSDQLTVPLIVAAVTAIATWVITKYGDHILAMLNKLSN